MPRAVLYRPHKLPHPDCTLRDMQKTDLPRVLEIERAVNSTPWGQTAFESSLNAGDLMPVVVCQETLLAYAVLKIAWQEAELLNIAVAPEWQRRSLGRYLVWHLLETAVNHGVTQVFLEVRVSNISAQQMYLKEQFEFFGRRKNYYATANGGHEDALLMRWML